MPPKLTGIDHIHLYVPNKQQAADWYIKTLGFRIVESLLSWNTEQGPLTIEDQSGQIHLALFQREDYLPSTAIAFKATGKEFLEWKNYLQENQLLQRCADHTHSWSLYFLDPFRHYHEITTYDVDIVQRANLSMNQTTTE